MHNFKELKVWQKARCLVKYTYILTKKFPKEEMFALTSQVKRAVVSISSNIAEGCGRGTNKQLHYFLEVAQGSSCELETELILSFDLGFITEEELTKAQSSLIEIQRMLQSLMNSLNIPK
jgi:four helix bundle protein